MPFYNTPLVAQAILVCCGRGLRRVGLGAPGGWRLPQSSLPQILSHSFDFLSAPQSSLLSDSQTLAKSALQPPLSLGSATWHLFSPHLSALSLLPLSSRPPPCPLASAYSKELRPHISIPLNKNQSTEPYLKLPNLLKTCQMYC